MKRKTLILLLFFIPILVFSKPLYFTSIPVFNLTNKPAVLTKGHYGQSLIIEISFSNEWLKDWLQSVKEPYPLLLLDADWIARSPEHLEIIRERKLPVGLLGPQDTVDDPTDFSIIQKNIDTYVEYMKEAPLWFATQNHHYSQDLQKNLFQQHINMLAPSRIWQGNHITKLQQGDFVFISLHQNNQMTPKALHTFLQEHQFISVEENIFGYKIQTKKSP
ncbi:hypothetical protein [Lysinibacillus piscis]|uniref:Uncharacterized protein n=1 Tax=Lysinibacillus piscis TaxID=2518931 RepID=A0ABQ5NNG0_9BACI|nr:hypothetical protein [Lysinibacillus sp. KH24]GLC89926.1 hypothetical protein LYSBPC_30530 [Lysinibacillus sp. KH24]